MKIERGDVTITLSPEEGEVVKTACMCFLRSCYDSRSVHNNDIAKAHIGAWGVNDDSDVSHYIKHLTEMESL